MAGIVRKRSLRRNRELGAIPAIQHRYHRPERFRAKWIPVRAKKTRQKDV